MALGSTVRFLFGSNDTVRYSNQWTNSRTNHSSSKGETITVELKNGLLTENMAIHWHDIRQIGTLWSNGTERVTQYPTLPGMRRINSTRRYNNTHREKNAGPNQNSVRGFEVIDTIKTNVEAACNATVSCVDILALAARNGVVLLGGPTWTVSLGRRDVRTASQSAANFQLPSPTSTLASFTSNFVAQGLNIRDLTVLSGTHTIGQACCTSFRNRIYNDTNIDSSFSTLRQRNCPTSGGDGNFPPLDIGSPVAFNNNYYQNLVNRCGLLHSDQELFNNGTQDSLVRSYSTNNALFSSDFAAAMIKMGNINPLTGANGEFRRNCRKLN